MFHLHGHVRRVRVAVIAVAAVAVAAVSVVVAPATASAVTSCTGTFPYNAWHYSGTHYAHEYGWYWGTTNPRAVCVGQADEKENVTHATGLNERVRVHNGPSNGPLLYQHESGGTISGDAITFITHVSRVFFDADVTVCVAVVHQSDQSVVPNTTVCKSLYS